ncbi:MAG: hypothetical protein BWX71_02283 [Deltaproteobacteria bacterium ADurb.Bin072]|nr:MAG: hypothetical protein BWX71_02283 [Deltaproteobacteria bacterium ADurb.Bin072]
MRWPVSQGARAHPLHLPGKHKPTHATRRVGQRFLWLWKVSPREDASRSLGEHEVRRRGDSQRHRETPGRHQGTPDGTGQPGQASWWRAPCRFRHAGIDGIRCCQAFLPQHRLQVARPARNDPGCPLCSVPQGAGFPRGDESLRKRLQRIERLGLRASQFLCFRRLVRRVLQVQARLVLLPGCLDRLPVQSVPSRDGHLIPGRGRRSWRCSQA